MPSTAVSCEPAASENLVPGTATVVANEWRLCRSRHKRHSYATHLLEAGVPLPVLQKQLGHENITTTLRYVHLSREPQVDSAQIVDKMMGRIQ